MKLLGFMVVLRMLLIVMWCDLEFLVGMFVFFVSDVC